MMNVIQIQEALKGMPLEQLVREMQMPSGQAPQFLVLGEIARRKQMEQEFAQRQGQPQTTVAEDAVTAAGVPQQGIASAARAMAPKTDMAMNTAPTQQAPVQGMADGGYVQKMRDGAPVVRGGLIVAPPYPLGGSSEEQNMWLDRYGETHNVDGSPRSAGITRRPFLPSAPPASIGGIAGLMERPSIPAAPQRADRLEPSEGGVASGIFDASDDLGYSPASMTAEEILAAASGPDAPLPTSPEVNRAVAAREARQSRIGMDTAEAATLRNRGDILANSALRIPGAMPPYSMPMGGLDALMTSRRPPDEVLPSLAEIESGVRPEYTAPPAEEMAVEPGVVTPPPEAPPMPRDDRAPAGTYTGTGVSRPVAPPSTDRTGGGIAAAMSPLETEIGNILQQREQRAQQDKWLALAQAGMALMSSRQPTFAGALGEAGLVGVEGFRKARDQYEEDRLSLMTAQERLRAARAAAGARGAATVKAETRAPVLKPGDIATYYGKRAEIIRNMDEAIDEETKELYRRELIALERAFAAATSAPFDATVGEEG